MKNRKVKMVRMHVGVQLGTTVHTSVDHIRQEAEMEITPIGVYVKTKGKEFVLPHGNIHSIELLPEDT